MVDEKSATGGCLCGRIRYEAEGEPIIRGMCLCRMCQKWSGTGAGMGVQYPMAAIRFTRGQPKIYPSSAIFERSFCDRCGSSLMTRYLVPPYGPDQAMLWLGTFDHPKRFPGPQFYFGIEGHLEAWLSLDERLPRINCENDEGLARARAEVGSKDE